MNEAEELSIFELFRMEIEERVDSLQRLLLGLGGGKHEPPALHALMREAHSLKGAARIAGIASAVRLTHAMEDRFLAAEQGESIKDRQLDALLRAVDLLRDLAGQPEESAAQSWSDRNAPEVHRVADTFADAAEDEGKPTEKREIAEVAPAIEEVPSVATAPTAFGDAPGVEKTFRISSARFDGIVARASDNVVKAQRLSALLDAVQIAEIEFDNAMGTLRRAAGVSTAAEASWRDLSATQKTLSGRLLELQEAVFEAESVAGRLHREILRARLRPLSEIVPRLQRLVRSVASELGKRVRLEIEGEGTEVDTDILEQLSATLEHLVRNALDHGLEIPGERKAAKKTEEGRLHLWARHHNGRLALTLSDDGRGIDIAAVRHKAQRLGLVFPGITAELSDEEVLQFLFLPGFSTRDAVSEISGRGFGLDVVQTVVQGAGGSIRMETKPGAGTTIHLTLPISRSVIRVLRVGVDDEMYALPLVRLSRVTSMLVEVDARGRPTVDIEGKRVPIVSLCEALSGKDNPVDAGRTIAIFLLEEDGAEADIAIAVDRLHGDSLVAIRQLDPRLGRRGTIAGVTLTEAGVPLLIIDPGDLVSTALGVIRRRKTVRPGEDHRATILVADDSTTVRQMLRRVLVRAAYRVVVAAHGAEAWALLQSQSFDLLVSDVDMPEMTGIELTERVRGSARLSHLPVVLLSYKGREEDRRRGLLAGADVYFSKGEFEESSFLQVVTDMIGPPQMESSPM